MTDLQASAPPGPSDWFLWQLADSAFPIGAFSHSNGVEAAWQHGRLAAAGSVADFTITALQQAAHSSGPFLLAACDPAADIHGLDALLDSTLPGHVANRASRLQGQALLATAERVYRLELLARLRSAALAGEIAGHFPIVLGVLGGALGIERPNVLRLFLYMTMRGVLSAAVRLGAVGPIEAQQIQFSIAWEMETLTQACLPLSIDDAAQTAPLIELWQGTQDRLYSRLFQS